MWRGEKEASHMQELLTRPIGDDEAFGGGGQSGVPIAYTFRCDEGAAAEVDDVDDAAAAAGSAGGIDEGSGRVAGVAVVIFADVAEDGTDDDEIDPVAVDDEVGGYDTADEGRQQQQQEQPQYLLDDAVGEHDKWVSAQHEVR